MSIQELTVIMITMCFLLNDIALVWQINIVGQMNVLKVQASTYRLWLELRIQVIANSK